MWQKKNNLRRFFNDRKIRWVFRNVEIWVHVNKCLQDSKFPTYDLNCIPIKSRRNICLYTGSTKGVLTTFRLSRHTFRKKALIGSLYGVRKSLW